MLMKFYGNFGAMCSWKQQLTACVVSTEMAALPILVMGNGSGNDCVVIGGPDVAVIDCDVIFGGLYWLVACY